MPKFGLFRGAAQAPAQTVDGDYMVHSEEYVTIYKSGRDGEGDEEVAAFHLDRNYVVKKL